ncbi:MAG: DUF3137 domain-containing protein [Coprobacillaceae bacterium]
MEEIIKLLEEKRRRIILKRIITICITLVALVILIFFAINEMNSEPTSSGFSLFETGTKTTGRRDMTWLVIAFGVGTIALFIYAFRFRTESKVYATDCKELLIRDNVKRYFGNASYDPEGMSEKRFKDSNLYMSYNEYHSSDLITGKMKDQAFSFSNVRAEISYSDGETNSTTSELIFGGYMIVLTLKKSFNSQTFIYKNTKTVNKQYKRRLSLWGAPKAKEIKTENADFDKQFIIKAESKEEAASFLTLKMMDLLMDLSRELDFSIAIHSDVVYIGIASKEILFNFSVYKKLEIEKIKEINLQFQKLTGLIDQMIMTINSLNE